MRILLATLILSGCAAEMTACDVYDPPLPVLDAGADDDAGSVEVDSVSQAFWSGAVGCYMYNTDPEVHGIPKQDQRKAAVAICTAAWGSDGSWFDHFWIRDQSQGVVGYQTEPSNSLVFFARSSVGIGGCASNRHTLTWHVMSCGYPDRAGCLNNIASNPSSNMPPNFHEHCQVSFSTSCYSDDLASSSVTVRIGGHTFLSQPWNGWEGFCEQH